MADNDILIFAEDATNILTDAEYAADSTLSTGVIAGSLARSDLYNKTLKQTSVCSAGLSQFTADNQDTDINDAMTEVEYAAAVEAAIDARVIINIGTNIITQPQFDNSTNGATDEFVNRALGSYSNVRLITGNAALSAADVGKCVGFNPSVSSNVAVTLPDYTTPADFRLGSVIEVTNMSTFTGNSVVISASAGQNLQTQAGVVISTVTLGVGDNATFVLVEKASTLMWVLNGGTASLQYAKTFGTTLASTGHTYLPGGLLMQWGTGTLPITHGDNSAVAVTFPIAFPTAAFNVFGNGNGFINPSSVFSAIFTFTSISQSGFTATGCANSDLESHDSFEQTVPFHWFAIGN